MKEYEAVLLYTGKVPVQAETQRWIKKARPVEGCWQVTLNDNTVFEMKALKNLCSKEMYPEFGGRAVYELTVDFAEAPDALDLGVVEEACKVFVNGRPAGLAVTSPYVFDIRGLVAPGKNQLRIEVECSPSHVKIEGMGNLLAGLTGNAYNMLRPCGLLGPVKAVTYG